MHCTAAGNIKNFVDLKICQKLNDIVRFISGQVKRDDLRTPGLRQFGIQEVDILSMAKSYTKYAVQLKEAEDVRYELEKAAAIAVSERPGPVWLDIPLDIFRNRADGHLLSDPRRSMTP